MMKRFLKIGGACALGLVLFLAIFSFLKPAADVPTENPKSVVRNTCLGSGPETSVVARQINFHVIAPGIWRSAEPNEESLTRMKKHGLKTLIDFRISGREGVEQVRTIAETLQLRYYHFPMNAFEEQDLEKIDQILAVMEKTENHPVLIHCAAGKDRTGTLAALYKIKHSNEKFNDIYKEMIMFGYDHEHLPLLMKGIRRWCETHGYPEIAAQISPDGAAVFPGKE